MSTAIVSERRTDDVLSTAIWSRLTAWPLGYFTVRYNTRRCSVTNTVHANGRSMKLYAEELGGADRISLNIYAPPRASRR